MVNLMSGNCSVPMHFMSETLLVSLSDVNVLVSRASACMTSEGCYLGREACFVLMREELP